MYNYFPKKYANITFVTKEFEKKIVTLHQFNIITNKNMEFTAKQIADFIGGRVEGDDNATVHTFSKIEEGTKGSITFLSNPKYTQYIYDTKASIVLVNNDLVLDHPVEATLIRVENAYECVAKLLQLYAASMPKKKGIDPLAFVSPTAKIGEDVYIGAFAYIGDGTTVGDNTQI